MKSTVKTPKEYIEWLHEDKQEAMSEIGKVNVKNLKFFLKNK